MLAAGSNAQGPLLIKEARLGVGAAGAPSVYFMWLYVCACLMEGMRLLRVNAYNNEGARYRQRMSHGFTHNGPWGAQRGSAFQHTSA